TSALLVALLPARATAVGAIVLAQLPSAFGLLGIALVAGGVGVHEEGATNGAAAGRGSGRRASGRRGTRFRRGRAPRAEQRRPRRDWRRRAPSRRARR